jgi:hypothetical protein
MDPDVSVPIATATRLAETAIPDPTELYPFGWEYMCGQDHFTGFQDFSGYKTSYKIESC